MQGVAGAGCGACGLRRELECVLEAETEHPANLLRNQSLADRGVEAEASRATATLSSTAFTNDATKTVMNWTTRLFARLLLPCLCLTAGGCMGPNPWTVDPGADCRSLGLTPGTMRFNECLLASKELQAGRRDPVTGAVPKSSAEIDALASQKLQTRACDPTTGLCTQGLLQQ